MTLHEHCDMSGLGFLWSAKNGPERTRLRIRYCYTGSRTLFNSNMYFDSMKDVI